MWELDIAIILKKGKDKTPEGIERTIDFCNIVVHDVWGHKNEVKTFMSPQFSERIRDPFRHYVTIENSSTMDVFVQIFSDPNAQHVAKANFTVTGSETGGGAGGGFERETMKQTSSTQSIASKKSSKFQLTTNPSFLDLYVENGNKRDYYWVKKVISGRKIIVIKERHLQKPVPPPKD